MVFKKPEWIDKDSEIMLHWYAIPHIPTINILSPKFHAFLILLSLCNDPEILAIVLLIVIKIKDRVKSQRSLYHHKLVALPLFTERDYSLVQLLIGDTISKIYNI